MVDGRLVVHPVVGDLVTPTTMAFLGPNECFVLEKNTGRVQHVVAESVQGKSDTLLIGRDFGVATDIKTAPGEGGVFVVSLNHGTVYEIRRR